MLTSLRASIVKKKKKHVTSNPQSSAEFIILMDAFNNVALLTLCRRYEKYVEDIIFIYQLWEVHYFPSRVFTTRDFREDFWDSYKYGKRAGNRKFRRVEETTLRWKLRDSQKIRV